MGSPKVEDLVASYLACSNGAACWAVLEADLAAFGFDRAAFARRPGPLPAADARLDDTQIFTNYDAEILRFFIAERAYLKDPMLAWATQNEGALSWGVVHERNRRGEYPADVREVLAQFDAFGLSYGYTYSLYDRDAEKLGVFGLCASAASSQAQVEEIWQAHESRIVAALHLFSLAVQRLPDRPMDTALSQRQREILRLVAEGKSTRDVAAMLNLHRRTVEDHLSAARRAIGAETTMHALALAVRHGRV